MDQVTQIEGDISRMASYWGARKARWRDAAGIEFEKIVRPFALYSDAPSREGIDAANMCFTEWALFDRPLERGRTPLQLYIERRPDGVADLEVARLRQIEQSQFFSRFEIVSKDAASGCAVLRDVRTGRRYLVHDPFLCTNNRWQDGTIAERIGCVDDAWYVVGQARLYDHATPAQTEHDGPGEIHPEDRGDPILRDAGFFLRLVRDVMGIEGRYTPTLSLFAEKR